MVKLCDLPEPIRSYAYKVDKNGDGVLSIDELAVAIDNLYVSRRTNRNLKKTIIVCVLLSIVLVAGIFAATFAGVILSKDFVIDENGFATIDGGSETMKTEEAITISKGRKIGLMSNQELMGLKYVTINRENLKFYVQGHARDEINGHVTLLVNGGTITYDDTYIVDATGEAKRMIETSMGLEEFLPHPGDVRWRKLELDEDEQEHRLLGTISPRPTTPRPPTHAPHPTVSPAGPTDTTDPTNDGCGSGPSSPTTPPPTPPPTPRPTPSPTPSPTTSQRQP